MPARRLAAEVVLGVLRRGRSLTDGLADVLPKAVPRDRGLVQELAYGTVRWAPRLEWWLDRLLARPIHKRDELVRALLLVGLYQLVHTRIPPHAAVSETVAAARRGHARAAGLINAVLRRFQREREPLEKAADEIPSARWAHRQWMLDRFARDWPADWEAIAEAGNRRPPMSLRVNLSRTDRKAYLRRLEAGDIAAEPGRHAASAVTLERPMDAESVPGLAEGEVSVQDEAAQLAGFLLAPEPGHRILDACAAPGGKTGHLAELAPDATLVAVDADRTRLERVEENLDRLGASARTIAGDAGNPGDWWDGKPFDRILLDAPCSGLGVIRRHPDIKLLRRARDLTDLAEQQHRLLSALWPMLAPGGRLVYATCSVVESENTGAVRRFLADHDQAESVPVEAAWGRVAGAGRQILPGEDGMDGFYYASLING